MRKGFLATAVLMLIAAAPATASELPQIKLNIQSIETPTAQVRGSNGERGAAIARLADGRVLLGGGSTGLTLFLYDLASQKQTTIGRAGTAAERLNDSRFAITDIAVLTQTADTAQLLISYPRYNSARECVTVVVHSYQANFGAQPSLKRGKLWFQSNPCVPVGAVQHAAGEWKS